MSIRKCTNDENEFLNRVFHKECPQADKDENYEWEVLAEELDENNYCRWYQADDDEDQNIVETAEAESYVYMDEARKLWGGEIAFDESITEDEDFTALHARILEIVLCDMGYMATYRKGCSENVGRILAEDLEDAIGRTKDVYAERSEDENNREYFSEHDEGIGWCKPVWFKNKNNGTVLAGTMNETTLSLGLDGRQIETPENIHDENEWEQSSGNCHNCPFLDVCQAFDETDFSC